MIGAVRNSWGERQIPLRACLLQPVAAAGEAPASALPAQSQSGEWILPRKPIKPGSGTLERATPQVPAAEPTRLTLPLVAGVISFPALGTVLAIAGMPTADIYPLLGYCGAIGTGVLVSASGGRKLITGLAELVLRVSQ